MKTKYPSLFGLVVALMLVASFVVPSNFLSPKPAEADPGICKWDNLMTPGYLPLKNDVGIYEPHDMAVGGDGKTILIAARYAVPYGLGIAHIPPGGVVANYLFWSNNNGISFTATKYGAFVDAWLKKYNLDYSDLDPTCFWPNVFLVAIAPDDPNFWAIVTDVPSGTTVSNTPVEVWVTSNAGGKWECTNFNDIRPSGEVIRCIDISVDYGGKRDIAVGTATGVGLSDVYVLTSTGFTGWKKQNLGLLVDFYAVKFSPTYMSDAALALVFANANATSYNISLRDVDANTHSSWAFSTPIEVKDPTWAADSSPSISTLNKADLELPSDFSGQAASLRRAYISLDSYGAGAKATDDRDGIFRIDDTTVYTLMDTSTVTNKSIYSIAYYGTYASGKLLAGERKGDSCTATVPTWFTDSPTTCPIPCWYPALKPTTGAAGPAGGTGMGGALVGWRADGQLAFAVTGSMPATTTAYTGGWYALWVITTFPYGIVPNDESAFAVSRNNGETWNQIALIDTTISKLTDIAPTPDCKTVYLASVNKTDLLGSAYLKAGFDSVWRTSNNAEVVAPYPPLPLGLFWERILTRVTAPGCEDNQTNYALLRIVPYCADPSGQIVAWGVYDTDSKFSKGIAAWSPDYGDYWANITPRNPIQDFTFESKTVLYFLSPDGKVQKMPYTGTAWATTLSDVDTVLYGAHTIAAYPEGKVLVGANSSYHGSLYAVSYSSNFNTDNPSFTLQSLAGRTQFAGDVHVAFHPAFKDNNLYFINDAGTSGGSVYRNNPAAQQRWADTNMMDPANGAMGCGAPHQDPQYGLWVSYTGEALYSAHFASDNTTGVCRTLDLLKGMPKPGIAWDCLIVGLDKAPLTVQFTLEPTSLKACGCCTLETDTTLYAIDDNLYVPYSRGAVELFCGAVKRDAVTQQGLVWAFTDCMAKNGPKLITADKTLIGCDPVSGRAAEVNLCWEQLCVANRYDIEIAKNPDFTIRIIDWTTESVCGGLKPVDVTKPCAFFPAGGLSVGTSGGITSGPVASAIAAWGNLECGHTYYWRVKVRECATGQWIRSPWSEVRSFTVKAGVPVSASSIGLQLLSPANGAMGVPVSKPSFSWSPLGEVGKYKFILAKDAALTQIVKEAEVSGSTAYTYDGKLDYDTNYFWQVRGLEPATDPSAVFSFRTEQAPPPPPTPEKPVPTPLWVWVLIAIGAILVIVTLVLIFKTRRV